MANLHAIQTSFSGGQLSPKLFGKVETDQYKVSLKTAKNVNITSQGEISVRGASRFVKEVKTSAKTTVLIPFKFGVNEDYQLEFGDGYVRVFNNNGSFIPVYTGVEVASSFVEADLIDLVHDQVDNLLYIASGRIGIKIFERVSASVWRFVDYTPAPPPISEIKTTETNSLTLSAASGTAVTVTATNPVFNNSSTNRKIEEADKGGIGIITVFTSTTQVTMTIIKTFTSTTIPVWDFKGTPDGTMTSSQKKLGKTTNLTASLDALSHASVNDYVSMSDGVIQILSIASGTSGTGVILKALSSGSATDEWLLQTDDWETTFPNILAFFQQRLWTASSATFPNRLWGTAAGNFDSFALGSEAADAISDDITSKVSQKIQWLAALQNLVIGNTEAVLAAFGNADSGLTPTTTHVSSQTYRTSAFLQPAFIGDDLVFVDATTKILRSLGFSFENNSYVSTDLSWISDELTGNGIVRIAFSRNPANLIWCVREDGALLTCLFDVEHKEVGWTFYETTGSYKDVSVITNNNIDQIWVVVEREINSATVQYVEVFDPNVFSDSFLVYDGVATTTITGLSHLEGEVVQVKSDGAKHPDRTVTGGEIELQAEATHVEVGLQYDPEIELLEPELNIGVGSMQGFPKRRVIVVLRVNKSFPPLVNGREIPARDVDDFMDTAVPLFTGDLAYGDEAWSTAAPLVITQPNPFPLRLVGVFGKLATNVLE